jgi:HK97 family phage portal protein
LLKALQRVFTGAKKPTSTNPGSFFGGLRMTHSGVSVTPETSMTATAVFSAVRVLSEDVAKLPWELRQRRADGGSEVLQNTSVARVLERPNRWHTSYEFRQMLQQQLCLRGNAFAVILRNGRGDIEELVPTRPGSVTIYVAPDGDLFYQISRAGDWEHASLRNAPLMVPKEDIVHLRWMTRDGLEGISPIAYHREAIGLSLAAEQHGAASFNNGVRPSGTLIHPGQLSKEAADRLREQWHSEYGGSGNAGKTIVLEEGMKFEPAKPSNEDQQFLESRRFQVEEIARIFRIPPHMIGHLDRATFSNIESQSLDYVKNTLMAWLELWEAALKRDLLREGERSRGQYIQFDTQRILRGTQKERYEAHQIALTNGIKSFNEVRREEGLNPVAGGDQLMRPLNMGFVGQPDPDPADQSGDNTDE